MRVLICGSRKWSDPLPIRALVAGLARLHPQDSDVTIVEGGAPGADSLARGAARLFNVGHDPYDAEWDRFGKAAGPIRNQRMLDEGNPDVVFAFTDDLVGGTGDMVTKARRAGLTVYQVRRVT